MEARGGARLSPGAGGVGVNGTSGALIFVVT